MIKEVMERYFPHWEPPEDWGNTWEKCECPVHEDGNPSASVSYELNAFNCHGCGYRGDYIKIIEQEEGVGYGEALGIAEGIAEASGIDLPQLTARKSRRAVPRPARFGS